MNYVNISDIKKHGAKCLSDNVLQYLIVNSKPKSVIIPIDEFEALLDRMEEMEDIIDVQERMNEETISMEEFEKLMEEDV